ncbi:hypothetical protein VQ056_11755 [Paenibacillus sp. JTLBN-2024]
MVQPQPVIDSASCFGQRRTRAGLVGLDRARGKSSWVLRRRLLEQQHRYVRRWKEVPRSRPTSGSSGFDIRGQQGDDWFPDRNVEHAYQKTVNIPSSYDGSRVMCIRFEEAAFNFARVWVNGHLVRQRRERFYDV